MTTPWFKLKRIQLSNINPKSQSLPMKKLSVGIIGCGAIARNAYLPRFTGRHASLIHLAACADVVTASAQKCAEEFSISRVLSPDELLADPGIELVVNLTNPEAHYDLNKRALQSGKHVYSEKPLALSTAEAVELGRIARERRLMLSCAPDTLLGSAHQNARHLLDNGRIGQVRHAAVWCSLKIPPRRYYRPAAGPMLDFGPYYAGALISLLGPIQRVCTLGDPVALPNPDAPGETFMPETPSHAALAFQFASGATGTLGLSSDAHMYDSAIEIIGTKGRLSVPDPNYFGGKVFVTDSKEGPREVESIFDFDDQGRGAGVADMALALLEKRPERLDADLAVHTTDFLVCALESIRTGRAVDLVTTCRRPVPMSPKSSANPFEIPSE